MPRALSQVQEAIAELNDLLCTFSLLSWDARTQLASGGHVVRGQQIASLTRLIRQRLLDSALARAAERAERSLDPDDTEGRRVLSGLRSAIEHHRRIPWALQSELAELAVRAQVSWQRAREQEDFQQFAPDLHRQVELQRELAQAIGFEAHPYDALMGIYEPGMTAARLIPLLEMLRQQTADLRQPSESEVAGDFPEDRQEAFLRELLPLLGYDLARGHLARSAHPFEVSLTRQDVRITTRYRRDRLDTALFGGLHECGHALYEQNVDPSLTRSLFTTDLIGLYAVGGTSYGAHEAQSRLWENLVGRSRPFWQRHYPALQQTFPEALSAVSLPAFLKHIHQVRRYQVRVEADEVSYNLHILLRVRLELALISGALQVQELPEAWAAQSLELLGARPAGDREGALQDIHWASGLFGSFPTYALGNLMSAQLFQAASEDTQVRSGLEQGETSALLAWLRDKVYRHGRRFSAEELLMQSTGRGLDPGPYLAHLRENYRPGRWS